MKNHTYLIPMDYLLDYFNKFNFKKNNRPALFKCFFSFSSTDGSIFFLVKLLFFF